TGDAHYMISDGVSKNAFMAYLEDLSLYNPKELKILIIDNAAFHLFIILFYAQNERFKISCKHQGN
ncbi:MAG: hypothetical protein HRT67_06115, partial [Flavobacteriaceae bacterium]|nr:hypothetical protein [Flavobacteriaceae bacterium]